MYESAHDVLFVQFGEEIGVLHIFLELLGFLRSQPFRFHWRSITRLLNSPFCLIGRINVRNIYFFDLGLIQMSLGFYRLDGIIEFHALSTSLKKTRRLKLSLLLSGLLRLLTRMVGFLLFNGYV